MSEIQNVISRTGQPLDAEAYALLRDEFGDLRDLAVKHPVLAAADKHVAKLSVAFRYAFAKGRQVMRRTRDEDQVVRAIERALKTVLPPALKRVYVEGGEAGAQLLTKQLRTGGLHTLAKKPIDYEFNDADPNVVEWAEEHAAELITNITETTRRRIRIAISDLVEEGDWELATDRIMAAVGDEDRAEFIAHHETMLASSEGQRESWRQATEEGFLSGGEKRVWIVTPDDKLCPVCEELEDTTADLDGTYPGGYDGPPAHVSCRCTEGIVS